ncbi:MAG: hypothetical protein LBU70_01325 [Chitinispirillales bacterium]|jgi:hypothetical protein|nr:hypothetical protein [Chitinispirillales bacterium]
METDTMWGKIKKGFKDGAVMSVEKIEEYAKIGKLKVDEITAKRKIERHYLDIGERYYDLVQDAGETGASDDLVIKKAVECIRSLFAEIAETNEKIKDIQRTAAAKRAADFTADEDYDDNSGV